MRKVCVVVTARPSYSRIKSALHAIDRHPDLQLQLVVSGSALLERYGEVVNQIRDDGFTVDAEIYSVVDGQNLLSSAKSTGLALIELASTVDALQPDVVVTIADRYETLATAIAASYMNIPLAHVQGGEVTGSIDEKVRHAVTKLADLHFVATEDAAERVESMGEEHSTVFLTGCPSIDLAVDLPEPSFEYFDKYQGVGPVQDISAGYIVVLQHPVTTQYEEARDQITETLKAVSELGVPTLWFWPNVDAGSDGTSGGIRSFRELTKPSNILFFKNMAPQDFLVLLNGSRGIVGNSSVAIRECAYLGVPAVNIGTRQDGRERGCNVLDVAHDAGEIARAIKRHTVHGHMPSNPLYGDGRAGKRIANILADEPLKTEKRLAY